MKKSNIIGHFEIIKKNWSFKRRYYIFLIEIINQIFDGKFVTHGRTKVSFFFLVKKCNISGERSDKIRIKMYFENHAQV